MFYRFDRKLFILFHPMEGTVHAKYESLLHSNIPCDKFVCVSWKSIVSIYHPIKTIIINKTRVGVEFSISSHLISLYVYIVYLFIPYTQNLNLNAIYWSYGDFSMNKLKLCPRIYSKSTPSSICSCAIIILCILKHSRYWLDGG